MTTGAAQSVYRRSLGAAWMVLAFVLLAGSSYAVGQRHSGGGGQQGAGQMGGPGGGQNPFGGPPGGFPPGGDGHHGPPPQNNGGGPNSTLRGGLQLGPPGRWWDDDWFAKSIGLDRNQQHRMDEVFKANKGQLVKLFKNLQHEESQMEKISRGQVLDEAQIDAQIDRVVQARGELEKANAHMLLDIRKEMTAEQLSRLDDHRPPMGPENN
jgi:Spy/CpxP family protein refolding chaperone